MHSERSRIELRITLIVHRQFRYINDLSIHQASHTVEHAHTHSRICPNISAHISIVVQQPLSPHLCFGGHVTQCFCFSLQCITRWRKQLSLCLKWTGTNIHVYKNMQSCTPLYAIMHVAACILSHLVRNTGWLFIGKSLWIMKDYHSLSVSSLASQCETGFFIQALVL